MANSLAPDTDAAIWFMAHMYPNGPWVLTALWPDSPAIETVAFLPGQEAKMAAWITYSNANAGIYFTVNRLLPSFTDPLLTGASGVGKKPKKIHVQSMTHLHVDLDAHPVSPDSAEAKDPQAWIESERQRAKRRLYGFRPRATAIINSGNGAQAFFRLSEPVAIDGDEKRAVEEENYNWGLANALDGDKPVRTLEHLMRLPGTINRPNKVKRDKGRIPCRSFIIEMFPDRANPVSDFERYKYRKPSTEIVKTAKGSTVRSSSAVSRLSSVDDLDRYGVSNRVKAIIVQGDDPDSPKEGDNSRSAWLWDVCCQFFRTQPVPVPDDIVLAVIMDPNFKISASVLDKPNPRRYAEQQIEKAKAEVANDSAAPSRTAGRPNGILMMGGELNAILDEAEDALLASSVPIYQRSELVRFSTVNTAREKKALDGIKRAEGSRILTPVTSMWLLQQMANSISWSKKNKKGEPVTADPDKKYADHLLARAGDWPFPVLKGLMSAPTLDRDGRIIERPGYDEASQLYLDFAPCDFPPVPEAPTLEDAQRSLAKLSRLFRGFPFDSEASRSVALAAILTALIRPNIKTAPLHAFDAPAAGSGKSMIVEVVGIIATGHTPAAMSQGKDDEEDEKRLSVVLREGDPIVWIDNCERPLEGDFLCFMLTQETVQARILGKSERVILPASTLVMATGNNLAVAGDATRRVVKCRLDAGVERPDAREFDFDCREEAKAARPELVVAALTALRAYRLSGVRVELSTMGSFTEWDWVRGTLVWAGYADPAANRDQIVAADPKTDVLADVMEAWDAVNQDNPAKLKSMDVGMELHAGTARSKLALTLIDASGRNRWNARAIGGYLARNQGRILHGRRFTSKESGGRAYWRLEWIVQPPKQMVLPGS